MHCPGDSLQSIALGLGDCIGMESCVDLRRNIDLELCMVQKASGRRRNERLEKMEKDYPPPISWLASARAPWIMKRYHTNDGRLVIKEEKAKRHEYIQANRSNGRLTLHLVPLEDDDHYDQEEVGMISDKDGCDGETAEHQAAEEEESRIMKSESCMDNGGAVSLGDGSGGGGAGGGGQWYKYSSSNSNMGRNSCMLGAGGVAVAAFRPVPT